ncbi:unnamed protein product [Rhizophagus irregularis]|nr:unnamed protein product [Rhizophagus irregularis]
MSDSEFMSSDDEIFDEAFDNDFIENIPNDSDSDGEDNGGSSNETLKLEVGMAFLTWKIAFNHIKQWAHQQGFGIRKGRSEKIESKLRKQTIVCFCEGVYNNQSKKTNKPSKTHRTNCKWHVNLSRPTKNNQNSMIFITTIVDEHSGHSLDPCARRFEADKAFTKPMLDDIEWMYVHGHLKPLAIKRMLKAKYKRKVYNKDLYKIIYKYHRNIDQLGNDVSQLFEYLEKCKEDDPRWIIYKDWDRETNTLTKLFWMNPDQLETWYRYNDMLILNLPLRLKSKLGDIQTTSRCESVNATFKNLLQNSNNTLVDIFFTIEERLEEEQDNTDYLNWQNSLPTIQSSTIASNAFTDVINELKDFTTPSIQKIHNNEMELAFSYDARPLDQSYINNEDSHDLSFANDFIEKQEVRQLSFQQLLLSCDQKEIKSLWGVSYLTSSDTHHLVILLDNGMYKCSCMSLINRGTVCRHYFCVMLRTSQAQFHIGFLNPRWFVETSPDLRSRPFCPASKFKMDLVVPYLESNNPPNFLHSINENILNRNNPYVTLSKQKLYYMNIKGLSKQASCVACKTCDESFVTLLEDYITKKNHEALELAQLGSLNNRSQDLINLEPDQENAEQLGNPIIRRPKGRPPGVARYKNPLEESSKPNEGTCRRKNQQNKCSLCNNVGHNRTTCPSNPNGKKRKTSL